MFSTTLLAGRAARNSEMADLANSRQQLQQLQQAVTAGEAENARLRREVDRVGPAGYHSPRHRMIINSSNQTLTCC